MALYTGLPPGIAPYIWISVGGALGAMARYALGSMTADLLGSGFPWGTLAVNMTGCFLIGIVMVLMGAFEADTRELWRFALVVGFLGSFTTFSTFSYEGIILLRAHEYVQWFLYAGGSVFGGLVMVVAGMGVGRWMG